VSDTISPWFTLTQSQEWTAKYDWRPHSSVEVKAIFTLWTEAGRRMGIEDIWSTYEEMKQWVEVRHDLNLSPF